MCNAIIDIIFFVTHKNNHSIIKEKVTRNLKANTTSSIKSSKNHKIYRAQGDIRIR